MWRSGLKTAPEALSSSHSPPNHRHHHRRPNPRNRRTRWRRRLRGHRSRRRLHHRHSQRHTPRATTAARARAALTTNLRIIPIARFGERVEHGDEDEHAEHDAGDGPGRGGSRVERVEVVVVVAFAHHVEHALDVHGVDELRDGDGDGGEDGVGEVGLLRFRVIHEPPCEHDSYSGYEQSEREHERGGDEVVEDGVDERRQRLSGCAGADDGEHDERDDEHRHHDAADCSKNPHNESLPSYSDILIHPATP